MVHPSNCTNCGISWNSPNTLPEDLLTTGLYGDIEVCKIVAANYGWTEDNDVRFSVNVVGEPSWDFSSVVNWRCTKCEGIIK